jgi:uncharacterized phage protein (TIGR01671 family)
MREIKFRAWDEKSKTWIYKEGYTVREIAANGYELRDYKDIDTRKLVWVQFTGRKDRNGKEIYFHDVVRIKGKMSLSSGPVNKIIVITSWYDVVGDYGLEAALEAGLELEILGNKFENPESLNK